LLAMRIAPRETATRKQGVLVDLKDGIAYAFGVRRIRLLLLLLASVSLIGMPYAMLLPVFAKDILAGQAETHGFLIAASALGALAGTMYLAPRTNITGLERRIVFAAAVFGLSLSAFSLSRMAWLSWLLLTVTGFAWVVQLECSNTVLQTIAAENKRGRVLSLYTMAFPGMVPLGSLLVSFLASRIGAPGALLACGLVCLCIALLFGSCLRNSDERSTPIADV